MPISSKYLGDGAIFRVLVIDLRVIIRSILDVVIDAMIFIFFPRISRETPLSFRMSLNLRSTEDKPAQQQGRNLRARKSSATS
jgi:hypothetical protein